jgi:hypothetical protein
MIPSPNYNDWEARFQSEVRQAEMARAIGNEGKARVCARRAAGIAIGEYFRHRDISPPVSGAYNILKYFQSNPDVPDEARSIAGHFLEQVDTNFTLPVDVDLIQDSRWLVQNLVLQNK